MDGGMEIYPEELAACKAYLRLEGDEEDALVTGLLLSARTYLAGAGVSLPPAGSPRRALYDLCQHGLALGWYERREAMAGGGEENPALRMILNQLKLTEKGGATGCE